MQYARCKVCGDREKYEGYEEMTEWDFGFDIESERDIEKYADGDFKGIHYDCMQEVCMECGQTFKDRNACIEHENKCC